MKDKRYYDNPKREEAVISCQIRFDPMSSSPFRGKILEVANSVDLRMFGDALERLPVNREMPGNLRAKAKAAEQRKERRAFAEYLAQEFTAHIIAAINSNDTVCGYEPHELTKEEYEVKRRHSDLEEMIGLTDMEAIREISRASREGRR